MTSDQTLIVAAAIGSLPGWAAVAVSLRTQRRTLPAQTRELKAHFDSTGTTAAADPVLTWGEDHVH